MLVCLVRSSVASEVRGSSTVEEKGIAWGEGTKLFFEDEKSGYNRIKYI